MKKLYRFAGIEVELDIPDHIMYDDERQLAAFLTDRVSDPHRFHFEVREELTPPGGPLIVTDGALRIYAEGDGTVRYIGAVRDSWEEAYLRVSHQGREHHVQIKHTQYTDRVTAKMVLNSLSTEHLAVQAGGFVFHSSYIQRNGQGILFTAPSGTGKSTQADLWESLRGAEIINGDRSVVRMEGENALVCGLPYSGSSRFCKNRTLPLTAIVYLKQAPRTTIRRLRGAEAFRRLWEGCSVNVWDRADMELLSQTVENVLSHVPVFELACTPDESAVIALEGVLTE